MPANPPYPGRGPERTAVARSRTCWMLSIRTVTGSPRVPATTPSTTPLFGPSSCWRNWVQASPRTNAWRGGAAICWITLYLLWQVFRVWCAVRHRRLPAGKSLLGALDAGMPRRAPGTGFRLAREERDGRRRGGKDERDAPLRFYAGKSGPCFACGSNDGNPCAWGAVKVALALSTRPDWPRLPCSAMRDATQPSFCSPVSRRQRATPSPAGRPRRTELVEVRLSSLLRD